MRTLTREPKRKKISTATEEPPQSDVLPLAQDWTEIFDGRPGDRFVASLQEWIPSRRWFRGKARRIETVRIHERITVPTSEQKTFLALLQVNYREGDPEMYVLPLAYASGSEAEAIAREWPQFILAHISVARPPQHGIVYDAIISKEFCHALLALTAEHHKVQGQTGDLEAEPTGVLRRIRREQGLNIEPKVSKAEQSNSSIIYGGSVILKFFRRLDAGINPELEIERFLSARHFAHSPALAGALEYHDDHGRTSTMAVLTSFIPGCHDAWEDTLGALDEFYKKVHALPAMLKQAPSTSEAAGSILGQQPVPQKPADLIGSYLQDAATLGKRTAALHLTLAADADDPAFRPEPWTTAGQQTLYESLQELSRHNFELLRQRLKTLPADTQARAEKVLSLESLVTRRFQRIISQPVNAAQIRTHGDYHLGQVLHHGPDFLIIDFEGEPAITLEERRAKQSAFRDVAGMIYSFFYAANAALREGPQTPDQSRMELEARTAWARYWSVWVGTTFLRSYLDSAGSAPFIPDDETALKAMLDVELLRKAIYELGYELNNRPDWVEITFQVLLDLLNPDNPI
jgi:maltose alpha-D-glucosyltransferase/alpha-amylase